MSGKTNEVPIWKIEVTEEGDLSPPWCFSIMYPEQTEWLSFGSGGLAAIRHFGGVEVRSAGEAGNEDGR